MGAYNLDRPSGQLKSTSLGLYRLPYFVYTGCGVEEAGVVEVFYAGLFYTGPLPYKVGSTPAGTLFYTGIPAEEGAGVEEGAFVVYVSLV